MSDDVVYFETPAKFRAWLKKHHRTVKEQWVGFWKKGSGHPSITWPESVDEALCFGWIDGLRKSVDADRYKIRFTPRKAKSIWSAVNVRRAEELRKEGRMEEAGLAAFEGRDPAKTNLYSFERPSAELDDEMTRTFKKNKKAWTFWEAQPPGYRHTMTWFVISAKKEETRRKRLLLLIDKCEKGERFT